MISRTILLNLVLAAAAISLPLSAQTQGVDAATWSAQMPVLCRVVPNITYLTASGYEAKVDLYLPRTVSTPVPTILHIHGGGWTGGVKETDVPYFLPYLEMGWA